MKIRTLFTSIVLTVIFFSNNIFAQISSYGKPYSFKHSVEKSVEIKNMPIVDIEALLKEDESTPEDLPYRFGYGFDVDYNLENSGSWNDLADSGKLWRLHIKSEGAYSINLIYDKFWLPDGAEFFIYNSDKSMMIGAFTSRNNKPHGKFATGLVKGEEIILEYYEPKNVKKKGEVSISRIIHGYRNLFNFNNTKLGKTLGFGSSESCNNNVYCPEAVDWENEVHSVGMIVLGDGTRLCTGSLINNVNGNYAPYFLTANHCLSGDVDTWVIWFNYESSTCSNPSVEPSSQTLSGTTLKASNSASDFALLMLDETPPLNYNVYYNGWSSINTSPTSSVVIHHPSGDIKKISYDYDPAVSYTYPGTPTSSHWKVTFDDGTTEPGSSGAPLINSSHKVVGQNHAGTGAPYCTNRTKYYGKFSMSWDYGSSSSTRLKDWLDPNNTGATTLNGLQDGMLTSGTLPANATWSGNHTLLGNVTIPNGVTLSLESGSTINLNGFELISTGGSIEGDNETTVTINGDITFNSASIAALRNVTVNGIIEVNLGSYITVSNVTTNERILWNSSNYGNIYSVTANHTDKYGVKVYNSNNLTVDNFESTSSSKYSIYCSTGSDLDIEYSSFQKKTFAIQTATQSTARVIYSNFGDTDASKDNDYDIWDAGSGVGYYFCFWSFPPPDNFYGNVYYDPPASQSSSSNLAKIGNIPNESDSSIYPNDVDFNEALNIFRFIKDKKRIARENKEIFNPSQYKVEYNKAIGKFKKVVTQLKSEKLAISSQLYLYFLYQDLELHSEFISYLEPIIANSVNRNLKYRSMILLAYTQIIEENYKIATEFLDNVLQESVDKDILANSLYDNGMIFKYFLKNENEAKQYFNELIKSYPTNILADQASDELERSNFGANSSKSESANQMEISNYPNPFNPTTQISYQIPKDGFVNLVVYNSLGQVIAELVNEYQTGGKYSVQFNATGLSSGVYFYKLKSGGFSKVSKMLLLR